MPEPSLGRIVLFTRITTELGKPVESQRAAIVTWVWGPQSVNLAVFERDGYLQADAPTSVRMIQPGEERPTEGCFCEWPPLRLTDARPLIQEASAKMRAVPPQPFWDETPSRKIIGDLAMFVSDLAAAVNQLAPGRGLTDVATNYVDAVRYLMATQPLSTVDRDLPSLLLSRSYDRQDLAARHRYAKDIANRRADFGCPRPLPEGRFPFVPDYATPPGATIEEWMGQRGLTRADLAGQLQLSLETVDGLIAGTTELTPAIAIELEAAIGSTAAFWLRLEERYRRILQTRQAQMEAVEGAPNDEAANREEDRAPGTEQPPAQAEVSTAHEGPSISAGDIGLDGTGPDEVAAA